MKPAAIDTPYPEHARKYMAEQAKHAAPVYRPEEVAHAILRCAERPMREVVVGGGPRLQIAMSAIAPRLTEKYMARTAMSRQRRDDEQANMDDALYEPSHDARRRGRQPGHVRGSSAYTRTMVSEAARAVPFVALGIAVAAGMAAARGRSH